MFNCLCTNRDWFKISNRKNDVSVMCQTNLVTSFMTTLYILIILSNWRHMNSIISKLFLSNSLKFFPLSKPLEFFFEISFWSFENYFETTFSFTEFIKSLRSCLEIFPIFFICFEFVLNSLKLFQNLLKLVLKLQQFFKNMSRKSLNSLKMTSNSVKFNKSLQSWLEIFQIFFISFEVAFTSLKLFQNLSKLVLKLQH